jgi:hypothetical protein
MTRLYCAHPAADAGQKGNIGAAAAAAAALMAMESPLFESVGS